MEGILEVIYWKSIKELTINSNELMFFFPLTAKEMV